MGDPNADNTHYVGLGLVSAAMTKDLGGRPPKLDAVCHVEDDGTVVTVAEQVLRTVRRLGYIRPAAASAGISHVAIYEWQKVAATAQIRAHGNKAFDGWSPYERQCVEFSNALEVEQDKWMQDRLELHQQVAAGGIIQTVTIIEVDPKGRERTTVKTSVTLPDARAIEWELKHRDPKMFADRVELTGANGGPVELSREDRAAALVESAREFDAKRRAEMGPARPRKVAAKKT